MTRFVVVIPLVLVGMLGIFAFIAAQSAQADRVGSAKGSVRGSMTGATTDYTFSVMTNMDQAATPIPTGMVDVSNASVRARPDDPGDHAQITVTFETNEFLAIGETITLEVADDLGVPSWINAADVSIIGPASSGAGQPTTQEVASPRSIIVETDALNERHVITLNIGNMDDSADRATDKGLAAGDVTVTFRQGAGLTNRTEGGSDDWFVKTSAESTLAEIGDVYLVPWTITLSSYADSRGEEITAVGKGFKNGTTTYFWRDADRDGAIAAGESVLCDAIANGADIAICFFTLANPPFAPGTAGNYVNAVDGRGNTAGDIEEGRTDEFKQIELESSLQVSPKQGIPGDSINVQLYDFVPGDVVTRIEFARTVDICDEDGLDRSNQAIPTCPLIGAYGAVGSNGSLSFSFEIPYNLTPGTQDLRIHTTNGNANTIFTVGSGELQLSTTDVLPNQRILINGSGFTKSLNHQDPVYIGYPGRENSSCDPDANGVITYVGSVTLGGLAIPWNRINDGDGIEVTSRGTWSAPVDLPVNSSTTAAGTRELKIVDCRGGLATVDLTFVERVVTMTPAESGVGTDDGSNWNDLVADTGSTATDYSHTGLTAGSTRHYRVSAINSAGTGPASGIAPATTLPADRAALVALYNATDGPNWENDTNWLSDRPLGEWHGVTTDAEGRVTGLRLGDNQLSGEIPAWLGNLANLERLYLFDNQLSGEIPSELGNLSRLEGLSLHHNQLSGEIPSELGNLANLEGLSLRDNQLSGEIPAWLGNLANLEWLSLNGNQLSGEIPSELGNLSRLEKLSLSYNQLTGEIPSELGNLSRLESLRLNDNQLSGEIPSELGNLANLERLRLGDNQLSGCVPEGLRDVPNNDLAQLGLPFCSPAGDDWAALVALYNATDGPNWENDTNWLSDRPLGEWHGVTTDAEGRVTGLRLNANQLTGSIPPELGDLSNLEWLDLHGNQLSGEIPSELGGLANLKSLGLSLNDLTGPIPAELGNLSNLEDLGLYSNGLTGGIPPELGGLSNLTFLSLRNNQLTGPIPPELGGLSNLESLYLAGNQLTGCIPEGLRDVRANDFAELGLDFCAGAPGAPTISALTAGVASLTVSWTAPANNGGPTITVYNLRHIETGDADKADANWTQVAEVWTTGSGPLEYVLTGLAGATQYDVQVRAVNAAGESEWSATVTETTLPAVMPGAPTGLTASVSETEARVDLSWIAPADTGGAPITGYKIEASDEGNNPWTEVYTTADDATGYTDEGADTNGPMFEIGTTRYYRVSAVNSVGTGPASNVAIAQDLVTRYDANNSGEIERGEVITAIRDYLTEVEGITRSDVIRLIRIYLYPTPTPTGPSNINYDIAADVPAEQVEIIRTGLQMAQDYLDRELGGGIPEDARNQITVKIVATGRGDAEPGGSGPCCTASGETGGVSTLRLFFDVAHPHWDFPASHRRYWTVEADHWKTAVHEYTHAWHHHLGCTSKHSRPLGGWIQEGTAEFVAFEAMIESGEMDRSEVMGVMLSRAQGSGELSRPLQDLVKGVTGMWPGHVGFLALHRLVPSAPDGILALRTLCEEFESGSTLPEAFETAFGVSLDDFYADFEVYREKLISPVTPPNFKVAFIGDQGLNDSSRAVLQLIKDEGADMVLHQGDFDYTDRPDAWDQQINQILGHDFPYFASIGNHDVSAWGNYQRKLQSRLDRISGARCTGDLGVNSFCTYRGLFFVLSGVGTLGSGHVSFIKEALASQEARESLWRICSWHKNQRLMQVGGKRDEVGWEPYEECRRGGAIIATGHEHSYSRTHLMDSFETQSIASTSTTVRITRGNSFAFVSGLGGISIRGQDDQLAAKPWWAAVHTSAQGADFGALFCTFNHKAVENRGHCYFKDLNGVIADEFEVIVTAASETPAGVKLPTGPTNINYDIASDVPAEQVEIIRTGLQMAQDYLDLELGGGIPEDARNQVTVKIVATGRGDPDGDGACCTAFGETGGVSTMRPFFDVAHPHWDFPASDRRYRTVVHWKIVVHEYTHVWHHHLGCSSRFSQPLGNWIQEGTAEFVAYEAMIESGEMDRSEVMEIMLSIAQGSGELSRPLRDFAEGAIRDTGIWPGQVGFLALHRLVPSASDGILSLRKLCEEVAAGSTLPEAFETAFGVSLDDFYAAFEEYRQKLLYPTPTPMHGPTPIAMPGSPSYVKWQIGPNVTPEAREAAIRGARLMHDYAVSAGFPDRIDNEFTVYLYHDVEGLIPAFEAVTGLDAKRHRDWSSGRVAEIFRGNIFITASAFVGSLSSGNLTNVMAHEISHAQRAAISGFEMSGRTDEIQSYGPIWLEEGIAYLHADLALAYGGIHSYEVLRSRSVPNDSEFPPLEQLETREQTWAVRGGDWFGKWAAELLASHSGEDALYRYHTLLQPGTTWQEAFEAAFGIIVEEFYDLFEDHRAAGFPEVIPPRSPTTTARPPSLGLVGYSSECAMLGSPPIKYDCRLFLVAGSGPPDVGDSGPATEAKLSAPHSVAVGPSGVLIADTDNHRIRRISSKGLIETIAGIGSAETQSVGDGGAATLGTVRFPKGIAAADDGTIYIADSNHYVVRKISPEGVISTVLGRPFTYDVAPEIEGTRASEAMIGYPNAVAADNSGGVYVAISTSNQVVRVDAEDIIHVVAGTGTLGTAGDGGLAHLAELNSPRSLALDRSNGVLYIAEPASQRVRAVSLDTGVIQSIPGIQGALSVALDAQGRLYFSTGYQVSRWDPISESTTLIAGTGRAGRTGEGGTATAATIGVPQDLAVDPEGSVYIADTLNDLVWRVSPDGMINVFAGGTAFALDGVAAADTPIWDSQGIAVDSQGNVVVTDFNNRAIRQIGTDGVVRLIAGASPEQGSGGDGGHPADAWFGAPRAPFFDRYGNLYFLDRPSYHLVRRIDPGADSRVNSSLDERISTVVGHRGNWRSPDLGAADGGPATSALLRGLYGLVVDSTGTMYIADVNDNRIRKISPGDDGVVDGSPDEIIVTIAGNGTASSGGDGGSASQARVNRPRWLAIDNDDNIYVLEISGQVRRIEQSTQTISTIAVLSGATSIDIGPREEIYFASGERVGVFDPSSRSEFTLLRRGEEGIVSPSYISVAPGGSVYIADAGAFRLLRLDIVPQD